MVGLPCLAAYKTFNDSVDKRSDLQRTRDDIEQLIASSILWKESTITSIGHTQMLLTEIIRRNDGQYSIADIKVWGLEGTPIPGGTGATESIALVSFPDNTVLELQFYRYTLVSCREII